MKTWEASQGNHVFSASVDEKEVACGESWGNPFTDVGGACSLKAFLDGTFQDLIRRYLGEKVLAEMVEQAAQYLKLG